MCNFIYFFFLFIFCSQFYQVNVLRSIENENKKKSMGNRKQTSKDRNQMFKSVINISTKLQQCDMQLHTSCRHNQLHPRPCYLDVQRYLQLKRNPKFRSIPGHICNNIMLKMFSYLIVALQLIMIGDGILMPLDAHSSINHATVTIT